ncbi:MAG: nucleoside deaminase [Salinivirgaceae bacterium]|nr:nucleoside deaminase [Salinivirgaceae bacterium]
MNKGFLNSFHSVHETQILDAESATNFGIGNYFITHSKSELIKKFADLEIGIKLADPVDTIIEKLKLFVSDYQPKEQYPDDKYCKESILQAIISFNQGGFGIGAILVDEKGEIIFKSHNSQIQRHRSDLHAEMTLLSDFEESPLAKKYMNVFTYKEVLTVYSSTEPCPMCLTRMTVAGVNNKYCSSGPDDGMNERTEGLPPYWKNLTEKYPCQKAKSSMMLQKIAHLMFYSGYLDNRWG